MPPMMPPVPLFTSCSRLPIVMSLTSLRPLDSIEIALRLIWRVNESAAVGQTCRETQASNAVTGPTWALCRLLSMSILDWRVWGSISSLNSMPVVSPSSVPCWMCVMPWLEFTDSTASIVPSPSRSYFGASTRTLWPSMLMTVNLHLHLCDFIKEMIRILHDIV